MKIEKVNDNQIRCTLTKEDLISRQLKLSELAYGDAKAKELFREMMQQASFEFGFEAENIPLMVEAIPTSQDSVVLIITKVESPDELDTRFSQFSPSSQDQSGPQADALNTFLPKSEGADAILDTLYKLQEKARNLESNSSKKSSPTKDETNKEAATTDIPEKKDVEQINIDYTNLYSFTSMDTLSKLAIVIGQFYVGNNSLYKNNKNERYYLFVHKNKQSPEDFNKVCNIIGEYGKQEPSNQASEAYYDEHFKCIIRNTTLQTLASLHR